MIETQKHQQSFEALGLFQIDFGLMTLISEMFLPTLFVCQLSTIPFKNTESVLSNQYFAEKGVFQEW